MSLINVTNIKVGNNFCKVTAPLVFQIEFECCENLKNDVEWRIIYVTSDGSGYEKESHEDSVDILTNSQGEIVLDAVCLGPLFKGILEFEFRVPAPDFTRMNPSSVLGMQAILVTGSYVDQEFIRIGYYTNNCYEDEELRANPPDEPDFQKLVRCIIDQPRVTRFPIKWDTDLVTQDQDGRLECIDEYGNLDLINENEEYTSGKRPIHESGGDDQDTMEKSARQKPNNDCKRLPDVHLVSVSTCT